MDYTPWYFQLSKTSLRSWRLSRHRRCQAWDLQQRRPLGIHWGSMAPASAAWSYHWASIGRLLFHLMVMERSTMLLMGKRTSSMVMSISYVKLPGCKWPKRSQKVQYQRRNVQDVFAQTFTIEGMSVRWNSSHWKRSAPQAEAKAGEALRNNAQESRCLHLSASQSRRRFLNNSFLFFLSFNSCAPTCKAG